MTKLSPKPSISAPEATKTLVPGEKKTFGKPFKPGQSGNPSGRPKSNPALRAKARKGASIGVELMLSRLETALENPMKVVQGPDGKEWLEPTISDSDVALYTKTLAGYGGYITIDQLAKIAIAARSKLGADEWQNFVNMIQGKEQKP